MIQAINNFLDIKDSSISLYDLRKANLLNKISGLGIILSLLMATSNLILHRFPQLLIILIFISIVFFPTILIQRKKHYVFARKYFCLIQLPLMAAACIYNIVNEEFVNTENIFLILAAVFIIVFDKNRKFLFYLLIIASFFSIRIYEYHVRSVSLDNTFLISSVIYLIVFMAIYYFISSYMNAFLGICQYQKLLIDQIEVQKNRLEKTNGTKNKLFSIVSHDLRQPIQMLTSLLKLEDELPEQALIKHRKTVKENVLRINILIETILTWAKSQLEGYEIEMQEVSINHLVESEVEVFKKEALQKNIRLNIELPTMLNIQSDPNHLTMALRNILTKCINKTPTNGEITIRVFERPDHHGIEVKNSGIGLDKNKVGDILRSKNTLNSVRMKESDTELGLTLCIEALEKIGGTLSIGSGLDQISQFTILLAKNHSSSQISGNQETQISAHSRS
ncbi:HAMP domain-containing sensor histidine kinase [Ekhidna sp.]|uniref:sensor histidine kinase n=1 Tax=Ekhidna sp. TaxID=2608089 RepID=UPI003297DF99